MECDDGKFEGRKSDYWSKLRKQIQETSGLGDDNIIFENIENFQKYIAAYEEYKAIKREQSEKNINRNKEDEVRNNEKDRRI